MSAQDPDGHDDGRIASGEDVDRVTRHHARIVLVAGVERWLSAAGLPIGHEHLEAGALEDVGGGETHVEDRGDRRGRSPAVARPAASARPLFGIGASLTLDVEE